MKKLITMLLLLTAMALLSGCSTDAQLTRAYQSSETVAKYQSDAAIAQKPTFSGSCAAGCEFEYLDPRDRVQVTGTKVTNNGDVALGIAPFVSEVAKIGVVAWY